MAEAEGGRARAAEGSMNFIGFAAVILFCAGWAVGVAVWFYATYHMLRLQFGFSLPRSGEHRRKAYLDGLVFVTCCLFVAGSSMVGVALGGW